MTSRNGLSADQFAERLEARRRSASLEHLQAAIAEDEKLDVPPPVTEVKRLHYGLAPKLPAEAFELARQIYYLRHGNIPDCAEAVIAAGLSDTDSVVTVRERLRTWWKRERWPKRPHWAMVALRDANFDGGLYRGDKCKAETTGNGAAPAGKLCGGMRLSDSEFCAHHDPRPEYVERRRRAAERLTELRRSGMVPLAPFQRFCKAKAKELLAEKKRSGNCHHKNTGWGLLADAMGVNLSHLTRLMQGKHSDPNRPKVTKIKAKTIIRYVKPLGLTFEDIYGKPPPNEVKLEPNVCPGCGGYKSHESEACRSCFTAKSKQCKYVNSFGHRCEVKTRHESGYCSKCREIVFRVPKPRVGRKGFINGALLLHALDEYRRVDNLAWVSKMLWSANIGGVCEHYKSRKSLRGQLVRLFYHKEWRSKADVETVYWELLAEYGPLQWPGEVDGELLDEGMVASGPFDRWLAELKETHDFNYKELAARVDLHPDYLSQRIRRCGRGSGDQVRRATVDRALAAWGEGITFDDLYSKDAVPA